ncbi:hypothetical protein M9H77_02233 [Catharanthus roseus]|uniref:Uncharacterized protein n=1 Tax=Catharanthus roseus TaxID=4058 RepID=A0ACC0C7W0_CATRO|nr:hypothetical protein M9H77_02233 [Catharanthus roseus]
MGINVRTKNEEHGYSVSIYALSIGHVPRKLAGDSTPQVFQEPLPNTSIVEESTKDECVPENKSEFEEGELGKENECLMESQEDHTEERQEMEIEVIEKSEGMNSLTNEANFFLVENSLCV